MYEWQSKKAGEAFDHILDTFSGGNTDFAAFMFLMREMDKRAAQGDLEAIQILNIMNGFSKLIKTANKVRDNAPTS